MAKDVVTPIEATELQAGKLFGDDFDFEIPDYQRPYSWGREQTLQLLDDLSSAMQSDFNEPYFLGSVVLVKNHNQPGAEVIDGQQRLTTLTILFAVLRDLAVDSRFAQSVHSFVEAEAIEWDSIPAKPRLRLRKRDATFFQDYVQSFGGTEKLAKSSVNDVKGDAQKQIRENALELRSILSNWEDEERKRLYKFIGGRTFLVVVTTPDLNSAYRIFSVMNSRGLPLSPADIFKSRVIGAISSERQEAFAERWEALEEDLERGPFGDLFLYIRTIVSKTRAVKGLLTEFPEQVLNSYLPGQGEDFITEVLEPYGQAAKRLETRDFVGDPAWDEVNLWLSRLSQLDNDDWRPAAIWALVEHGTDAQFLVEYLKRLERLAASMLIRRVYSTPRVQRYLELLRQLAAGDGLGATAFSLNGAEVLETIDRLNGEIYLVNPVRKYVLLRLDSLLAPDPGVTYSHRTITVEHVLPQHPALDSQWSRDFNEDQRAYWVHRLGNLLLLSRTRNSQAQNFDFSMKKRKYFTTGRGASHFVMTSLVLNENEWTVSTVQERHSKLVDILIDEWSLHLN